MNKFADVEGVIKIMKHYNKLDLLHICNESGQTPLHLAIRCNNCRLVFGLLDCYAVVGIPDVDLNTPLHYAIKDGVGTNILKYLVRDRTREHVTEYIDLKNAGKYLKQMCILYYFIFVTPS